MFMKIPWFRNEVWKWDLTLGIFQAKKLQISIWHCYEHGGRMGFENVKFKNIQ